MVNLPRFNKTADEVKDPVDIWLYVLKHAHEGKPLPDFGNDIVNEALNRIKIENLDKTTLTEAEREMTTKEEIACCLASAKIETRRETRHETKIEMVDAMLANGKLNDEEIAAISGFSKDDILKRKEILTKRR